MKYYKPLGIFVCALLAASCYMPWAWYPDLQKSFTGFFSEQNIYGRPGVVFVFFAGVSLMLILLNRIWAKRLLIFIAAINMAYFIKTYILFTTCYFTVCPEKQYGIFILMAACILLMVVAVLPNTRLKLPEEPNSESEIL